MDGLKNSVKIVRNLLNRCSENSVSAILVREEHKTVVGQDGHQERRSNVRRQSKNREQSDRRLNCDRSNLLDRTVTENIKKIVQSAQPGNRMRKVGISNRC